MTDLITDPREAARRLGAGALVALPTETVYGLGADARNPEAVRRVFEVKSRPPDHPLIVHLATAGEAESWALDIDPRLADLMQRHWPGPLTVVVPKAPWVSDLVTGGQSTVALRVPDHPLTLRTIAELAAVVGTPTGVVAPSANRFGQVSPTTANHVLAGLGTRLRDDDAVLDGGSCRVGVESTVVAVVDGEVRVLRPGAVHVPGAIPANGHPEAPRTPGTLAAHYAPDAQVVVAEASGLPDLADQLTGVSVALLAPAGVATPTGWRRLASPPDSEDYARQLYACLRRADDLGAEVVVATPPTRGPLLEAVVDRLLRAAAGSRRD